MPLFRTTHRQRFLRHDHEFEHYAEHYTDNTGLHRMDLIISAGGGVAAMHTPSRTLRTISAGASAKVQLEHIVKPFPVAEDNKFHYTIIRMGTTEH
jgi:hypothetical protein